MNQTIRLPGFMHQFTTCTRRRISKLFALVVLVLLAQLAIVPCSPAATLIFDGNTGTTGAQDGAGNWDTTTADWWNGTTDVAWDNTTPGNAVFGAGSGAAGTISVGSGTINVANITNNPAGSGYYTISGNTLTLVGNPTISVAAGTGLQLNSYLAGTGYTLEGGGWLTNGPSGNNTYNGATIIDNGGLVVGGNDSRVYLPGDVIVNANGTLMFTSGANTGGILGGNKILILNGGVLFGTSSSKYLPVSKIVMDNAGQMQGLSITIMTNLDARSGLVGGGKGVGRYVICTLAKSTAGTLTITNQMYSTGVGYSNVTLNAGLLVLDKSVEKTASKITGPLIFGGGTLILTNGSGAAAGGESKITATTVNPGASAVKSWTGAGASAANGTIALTAIARQVGGTLDINTNTGGGYLNTITTTTANNNGILGGWATLNSADWAVGTTMAPYSAYTISTDPTTWAAVNNVSLSGSPSPVGDGTSINSLKLTAASTVTLNGALTLASGGLLVTGSGATAITGGTLEGGSGADLIVQQYASGDLTVSSTLADNTSASSLTKSGPGKLIINGVNNMTGTNYLNAGVVEVGSMGELASGPIIMTGGTLRYTGTDVTDTRAIMLDGLGGTFDVSNSGTTLTAAGNIGNSDGIQIVGVTAGRLMGNLGGLTKIGAGKLVLTGSNYFNGLTVVSNGTLLVNGTNTYDTTTFNAGNVTVYGGVLGGTGTIMGNVDVKSGGTISPGASIGKLTLATNLILESGSTNLFEESNSVAGDLLQVQGNLTIQPNCTIAISVLGAALEPVTRTLITYTGTKSGSFNSIPVIVGGAIDGSYTINDSTPGQINLVVTPQVTITGQPSGVNIVDGQAFSLNVSATGTAPLTYQWYLTTDTNNPGTTTTLINGATGSSYSVSSASSSSDNGYYSVVITNNYNSVTSLYAYVHIAVTAPVLCGLANQTVIEGNNVTLTETLCAGAPAPTYQWYFGSTPLTDDGIHIYGSTSLSLTITNAQYPADQGTYSLVASNVAGTYTNTTTLTVYVPPVITPQPTNLTVNVGDTASFVSGATGIPAPGLQWYKNGVGISGQTSGTLTIVNAQGSDVANYYLVATNIAGSATSSVVRLTVVSTNLAATTLAPANGATGVCYDTPLYITFNGPVSIVNSGKIRIYNAVGSTLVDTIDMSSNTVIISTLNLGRGIYLTNNIQAHSPFQGDSTAFNYFPVIIRGATAAIYPHSGVLTSNQTYYVTLDSGIVNDSGGAQYAGISDTNAWRFTTKPAGPANPTNLVVDAGGNGDFATVQGAVDSIPLNNNNYTLININNGNYVEIVDIASKSNVTLRGQSRAGTIISYGNNANIATGSGSTHSRMSFKVYANDIKLENLTLWNSTPQGGSQAEALMIESAAQRFILNNCEVKSFQDTILANVNSSQGYFYNSTIKGNYDFIWGGGNLFFTNCTIITVSNIYVTNNYNLNASRTDASASSNATYRWLAPDGKYAADGFSYVNCQLITDPTVTTVTFEDSNGQADDGSHDGLVSFINCCVDTNHYVAPGANIMTNYLLWQYGNDEVTCTYPVDLGLTNLLGGSDPRLLAAENATNWLYGWAPQMAPNITGQPADVTVSYGQFTSFSVSATGIPDPTYQWYQNGLPISGATGNSYVIASAVRTNGGNYTVVVSNGSGSVTSSVATLTYTDTAPVANPATYSRPAGSPLNIPIAGNLATNWSDVDGDPLALTGAISSTNGAAVSYDSSTVYYANANNVTDEIDYTVGDGFGGNTPGIISILVGPPATNSVAGVAVNGNGSVTLSFVGVANYTYEVDATTNLTPPVVWTTISTNIADLGGQWQVTDLQATNFPNQFYRSVYRP